MSGMQLVDYIYPLPCWSPGKAGQQLVVAGLHLCTNNARLMSGANNSAETRSGHRSDNTNLNSITTLD